jgi:hypothetical protein
MPAVRRIGYDSLHTLHNGYSQRPRCEVFHPIRLNVCPERIRHSRWAHGPFTFHDDQPQNRGIGQSWEGGGSRCRADLALNMGMRVRNSNNVLRYRYKHMRTHRSLACVKMHRTQRSQAPSSTRFRRGSRLVSERTMVQCRGAYCTHVAQG